ncbi:MAG: hypothetical protein ABSD82_06710 [Solirubrobacteraceae bacterium]|jgi:hypothetical protein
MRFRLLWHAVTVETDEPSLVGKLEGLVASAEHPMAAARTQQYRVRTRQDGLEISEEGDLLALVSDAVEARDAIHERSQRRAFELAELKGWLMLRGALVDVGERRLLLLGPPGAGKTILTLRLGLCGAAIQGDDRVLFRHGQLLAVPRPLAVPEDAGELVPELAAIVSELPRAGGRPLLDPARALALPWRLRIAPADHVVALERAATQTGARPVAPNEILGALASALAPPRDVTPRVLGAFAALLQSATAHRLSVSDPGTAARAIRAIAC